MYHRRLLFALVFLSALHFWPSSSVNSLGYPYLRIDCGSSNETTIEDVDGVNVTWHTDEEFIKTGKNALLNRSQNFNIMNTLRYFPDGIKNCYEILFASVDKYLLRAGFFYGNYDGLSRPPSFNLEIDGNLWASVTASMNQQEPVYHELIYKLNKEQTTVCLVRTSNDGVPFISSLEAARMAAGDHMFKLMENKTALYLQSRIDYGSNKSVEKSIGRWDDRYYRIWKSKEMSDYLNISAEIIPDGSMHDENSPPGPLMATVIRAKNITDSIYLSVKFCPPTEVTAYFVLYFKDITSFYPPNQTNRVDIYIDSQKMSTTDIPLWGGTPTTYSVVSLYPVKVFGSANVTISPTENSTLAPVLNAMEVFSVIKVSKAAHVLGFSPAYYVVLLQLVCILVVY